MRAQEELSRIRLNYWLSVFFTWIPALVFYLLDKDKASPKLRHFQVQNLNFTILRFLVAVVAGVIDSALLGIVLFVLFVLHVMAAVKVGDAYRSDEKAPFKFNVSIIR